MKIKVKIKPKSAIKEVLTEGFDNQLCSENIVFTEDLLSPYFGKTIECEIDYNRPDDDPETMLPTEGIVLMPTADSESVLHYSWIESFNDEPLLPNISASKPYIQFTANWFYSKDTDSMVHVDDISICIECGAPVDEGQTVCQSCLVNKYFKKNSYSYKPEFKFLGKQKGKYNKHNEIWYGIELEYGINDKLPMAKLIQNSSGTLYLKDDSSISAGSEGGAELVTHPMSFDYLKSAEWIDTLSTLDVNSAPKYNGCHIHISRSAFKDDKHYAKFKYLLQSNVKFLETVGGRKLTNYCAVNAPKNRMFKTKKDKVNGDDRKVVCNESNSATIELRFMASTKDPKQLRRYIQYIDSMVKYTAYHYNSASYEGYFKYVSKYSGKYPIILDFCRANKDLLKGSVTYKAPKTITKSLRSCTLEELALAVKVVRVSDSQVIFDEGTGNYGFGIDYTSGNISNVFGCNTSPDEEFEVTLLKEV